MGRSAAPRLLSMSAVGPLAVPNRSPFLYVVAVVRVQGFFGFVGMHTRKTLETFECIDDTALMLSAILLCLIFVLVDLL